ncbi:Hypothetical protein POVN_LOCUS462 [uncultured virus]|nr:Hypothetical protein POVN_LOCUS462 [uncultured virus]
MTETKEVRGPVRKLAWLTRHALGMPMWKIATNAAGYLDVAWILKQTGLTADTLAALVKAEGERYEYNKSKTKLRATYGHSIGVMKHIDPAKLFTLIEPDVVYTSVNERTLAEVLKTGLAAIKGRAYILLSTKPYTPKTGYVALSIDAKSARANGIKFYSTGEVVSTLGTYRRLDPKYVTQT